MEPSLHIDITAMQSLHRFGDIYEEAVKSIDSALVSFTPLRSAKDCIGRHWYGMRCKMESKATGQGFYLHTGLIFLPSTRTGLMVEVDQKNNLPSYEEIWNNIKSCAAFDVERGEAEYLKLFMPDNQFDAMTKMERAGQVHVLAEYLRMCGEAICLAAARQGFQLSYQDLAHTYTLALAAEKALQAANSSIYTVEINHADPDNFGQYASGYRYYLCNPEKTVKMYAYFGAIYSYKKAPAGIFAEIDWFSNQEVFDNAYANMQEDAAYEFSRTEPKFIKLFMPKAQIELLNTLDAEGQQKLLNSFLDSCNRRLMEAALA